MKKTIRLTESDLTRLIKRIISEAGEDATAEQSVSEINSMFEGYGLPSISLITLTGADDNVLKSMENTYSKGIKQTGGDKVNTEGIKQKALNYYCSIKNDKRSLKDELKKVLDLRNSTKTLKEGMSPNDLVYIIGFAIIVLVLLITGIRRGRGYGCPVNAQRGFGN